MKDMDLFNGTSAEEPTPMVGLGTTPPFARAALSDFDLIEEIITEDDGRSGVLPAPPPPPPPPPPAGLLCHTSLSHNHRSLLPSPPSCPRPVLGSLSTAFKPNLPAVRQPACSLTNMASAPPSSQGTNACLLASRSTVSSQNLGDINILERVLEKPRFVVVEEPKDRGMRFRYECEGRSAGSILGASSTDSNKTQPAIEIQGPIDHIKQVTVTVSLVTKDLPHRPHPHCLVGKDCPIDSGICVVSFNPHSSRRHSFANLGIQCVKRKDLDLSLQKRRSQNIDPFQTGHTKGIEDMDMNAVRLCFQCELEWDDGRKDSLSPVVSKPIYDKKATTTSQLKISLLNQYRGSCTGKTEIYMLCDKVQKDDIEIIFRRGSWKANGEFALTDVHRQIAIVFKTPPYQDPDISEEVAVSVVLRRISDQMESEPVTFTYLPHNQDLYGVKRKRANIKSDMSFKEKHCVVADSLPSTEQAILYLLESQNTLSPDERPHLTQAAGPSMEETPYTEAQNPNTNPDEINQLLINQLLELPEFCHLFSDSSISANVPCGFDSAPPACTSFPNTSLHFNQNFGTHTQDFSHYSDLQFNMLVNESQNQQPEQPDGMVQVKTEEAL